MTGPDETQRIAIAQIYAGRAHLSELNCRIWDYAEPAWREYQLWRAYCDLLRAEGCSVDEGPGRMPTAFAANWGRPRPYSTAAPNMTRRPANRSKLCRTGRRGKACIRGRLVIPTPHSALGTASLAGKAAM